MPEGNDSTLAVKAKLTPWREIVLLLNQVLAWEKPFYPAIIAGGTTVLYFFLYLMDMSNLTLVPLLIAAVLLADFGVPLIAPKIFDPSKWSASQEQDFEKVCGCIATCKDTLGSICLSIMETKDRSPKLFLMAALVVSLFVSYMGTILNGFFAAWAATLAVLMLPGLKKKGALDKAIQFIMSKTKLQ